MACVKTFCGLCIYSTTLDPVDISEELGIQATRARARDPSSPYRPRRERSFWNWSNEDRLESTDYRDHLQSIFDQLEGKEQVLAALRDRGCELRISCFVDAAGNVEVWLDKQAIQTLARLGLDIWWDIFPSDDQESSDQPPTIPDDSAA